jgi:transketolase
MRVTSLECVYELAKKDDRVVFIGSDLGPGTLERLRRSYRERFFMEGICEQHVIGMAAGLALEGFIPFVNTIGTFLTRRCYEQIVVDLCLHNVPVRLIGYGGGVVYAPLGPTHQSIEDFAILRALPNMTVLAPCDAEEVRALFPLLLHWPNPVYVRLSKGDDPVVSTRAREPRAIGKSVLMRKPGEALIISTGVMTQRALEAAERLAALGYGAGVLHVHTVKPLDREAVAALGKGVGLVVTVEEHLRSCGLGSAVLEALHDGITGRLPRVVRLGLPDAFVDRYGTHESLLEGFGLTPSGIVGAVLKGNERT